MGVRWQEHLDEMHKVKAEMKSATGWRRECLLKQYNRMAKELKTAQRYLGIKEGETPCRKG